jgi:hypothetical protein
LDVIGSKETCENMVITKLERVRDSDHGTGAGITISLKEIRFVETQLVPAPAPTIPTAKPQVSKGTQHTSDVPKPKVKSLLAGGAGATSLAAALGLSVPP